MSLGEAVRRLRMARNWKQQELARRTAISQQHISNIESGRKQNATGETLTALAKAFEIPLEEFLAEAGMVIPPDVAALGIDPAWLRAFTEAYPRLTEKERQILVDLARQMGSK